MAQVQVAGYDAEAVTLQVARRELLAQSTERTARFGSWIAPVLARHGMFRSVGG